MRNGAFVEILGRLGSDIQIRSTREGKPYGVLSIAVNKKVRAFSQDNKLINITKWFKAIVWNEHLLVRMEPLLKKGKKILLIGELDVIQPTVPGARPHNIIIVKSSTGIAVLSDPMPPDFEEESLMEEQEDLLPEEVIA